MTNISAIVYAATSLIVLESLACGDSNSSIPVLNIDAGKVTAHVSPTLYGLMTEEINHSYEGGIYGELIQNRIFRDDAHLAKHWSVVQDNGAGNGTIALDESQPIDGTVLTRSLKLDASKASLGHRIGVANDGYWGIPVEPKTVYAASFYSKVDSPSSGPLTVSIESNNGAKVFGTAKVSPPTTARPARFT